MFLLRVSLGFLLVIIGLGYSFDPKAILRINATVRETFFKDSYVLLNGKKIGGLLILIGFLLLALGYQASVQ
jgi:hypothetical protein